jgi:flagellar hook-length control protein FliK
MLPTLSIPRTVLPEPPSAAPGPQDDDGDHGGFAQLLQQAQVEPQAAPEVDDTPPATASSPKDARGEPRTDTRARGMQRPLNEHRTHDADKPRNAATRIDDVDAQAQRTPLAAHALTDAAAIGADAAPTGKDKSSAQEPCIAAANPTTEPLPTALLQAAEAKLQPAPADGDADGVDSRVANGRISVRIGARDVRSSARIEGALGLAQNATAPQDATRAADASAAQATKDLVHTDLGAGSARAAAPPFEHNALDASNAAASGLGLAREWNTNHTQALRGEGVSAQEASLHASIDEPGFAAAFGSQVAVWVRDGVQEARLQLHPAELGPVTVHIALEGNAAHVDFTAAVAATRDSIEQSLPALAAALREQGFTLAGGGVSARSGQGNDANRERHPEGRGTGAHASTAIGAVGTGGATTGPRRWARSLLDVYA